MKNENKFKEKHDEKLEYLKPEPRGGGNRRTFGRKETRKSRRA